MVAKWLAPQLQAVVAGSDPDPAAEQEAPDTHGLWAK
jgi:hypothetical protein